MNVLIIYDNKSTHVKTIYETLSALNSLPFNVKFANGTGHQPCKYDLNHYCDLIIIHYSVRLSIKDHLSPDWSKKLENFEGPILAMIQDEFDTTHNTREWLKRLNIKQVYSLIPQEYIPIVYPNSKGIKFETVLAGFVTDEWLRLAVPKPLNRSLHVGYRGRDLPYWYGEFGQEKAMIGQKMKPICQLKGISHDIEWNSSKRIYNQSWYEFLQSINFMLGTEGGSNVLDEYGAIRAAVEQILKIDPDLRFEDIYQSYIKPHEGRIITNQLTPKIFEAAAFKTGLILFEGHYSGIIKPNKHYIPLKKDFSNVDCVIDRTFDQNFCRKMIECTYEEIIENKAYHITSFIDLITKHCQELQVLTRPKWKSLFGLVGSEKIEIHYKDKI